MKTQTNKVNVVAIAAALQNQYPNLEWFLEYENLTDVKTHPIFDTISGTLMKVTGYIFGANFENTDSWIFVYINKHELSARAYG